MWRRLGQGNRGKVKKDFSPSGIPLKEDVSSLPALGVPFLGFNFFFNFFFFFFFLLSFFYSYIYTDLDSV